MKRYWQSVHNLNRNTKVKAIADGIRAARFERWRASLESRQLERERRPRTEAKRPTPALNRTTYANAARRPRPIAGGHTAPEGIIAWLERQVDRPATARRPASLGA